MDNAHKTILQLLMATWLKSDFRIIDTETTGLADNDEIIEISIINMRGDVLLDTLVKPTRPIPAAATAINNITNEMVADAPSWQEVFPAVVAAIGGHKWLAWNSKFDARLITQTCLITGLYNDLAPAAMLEMYSRIHSGHIDAKKTYSQWYGAFSVKDKNFVRQPLAMAVVQQGVAVSAEAHRSLADCQRVLRVLESVCNDPHLPDSGADLHHSDDSGLAPCPFCYGPPSVFVHHLHGLQYKPLWNPANYGEDGLYAGAVVFCHECGAHGEEATDVVFDDSDVELLENAAKKNWNTRDKRHQGLYEYQPSGGQDANA